MTDLLASASAPTGGVLTLSFTPTGYQRCVLLLDGVRASVDNASLWLRFSQGGMLQTAAYRYHTWAGTSASTTGLTILSQSAAAITLIAPNANFGLGNAAPKSYAARVSLSNLDAPDLYPICEYEGTAIGAAGSVYKLIGAGNLDRVGPVDGVQILAASGTLTAGRAAVYGVPGAVTPPPPPPARTSVWLGAIL